MAFPIQLVEEHFSQFHTEEYEMGTNTLGFLPITRSVVFRNWGSDKRDAHALLAVHLAEDETGQVKLSSSRRHRFMGGLPKDRFCVVHSSCIFSEAHGDFVDRVVVNINSEVPSIITFHVFDFYLDNGSLAWTPVGSVSMRPPEPNPKETYVRSVCVTESTIFVSLVYGGLYALPINNATADRAWLSKYFDETRVQESVVKACGTMQTPLPARRDNPKTEREMEERMRKLQLDEIEKSGASSSAPEEKETALTDETFLAKIRTLIDEASPSIVEILNPLEFRVTGMTATSTPFSDQIADQLFPTVSRDEGASGGWSMTHFYVGAERVGWNEGLSFFASFVLLQPKRGTQVYMAFEYTNSICAPIIRMTSFVDRLFILGTEETIFVPSIFTDDPPVVLRKEGVCDACPSLIEWREEDAEIRVRFFTLDANHRVAFYPASNRVDLSKKTSEDEDPRGKIVFVRKSNVHADGISLDMYPLPLTFVFGRHAFVAGHRGTITRFSLVQPGDTWERFVREAPSSQFLWSEEDTILAEEKSKLDALVAPEAAEPPPGHVKEGSGTGSGPWQSAVPSYSEIDQKRLAFLETDEARRVIREDFDRLFSGEYGFPIVENVSIVRAELSDEEQEETRVKRIENGENTILLQGAGVHKYGHDVSFSLPDSTDPMRFFAPDLTDENGGPDWASTIRVPKIGLPGAFQSAFKLEGMARQFLSEFVTDETRRVLDERFRCDTASFASVAEDDEEEDRLRDQRRIRWVLMMHVFSFFTKSHIFVLDMESRRVAILGDKYSDSAQQNAVCVYNRGEHFVVTHWKEYNAHP